MLHRIVEAIRSEALGGWLFSNFRHRDPLSDALLGVRAGESNTRRWFYALGADGRAVKIVHAIEAGILSGLPGEERRYSSLEELRRALAGLAGRSWACDFSENLPVVSYLDAGTLRLLESCGLECRGAESLIQRVYGLLDPGMIASHRKSAEALGRVVEEAWTLVRRAYADGEALTEGRIRRTILGAFDREGLSSDHPPIVAAGTASGDPHYDFSGEGRTVSKGEVIQLDIWAKGRGTDDIYADISWVGVFAERASADQEALAADLFAARDLALETVRASLREGKPAKGSMVDARTRDFLSSLGYGPCLRHRTGHGIDRECHGSGVNLDSVEFPDERSVLEGSCFSIEPGIYRGDFGMRTEIDVYIEGGEAKVSGPAPQSRLLLCGESDG